MSRHRYVKNMLDEYYDDDDDYEEFSDEYEFEKVKESNQNHYSLADDFDLDEYEEDLNFEIEELQIENAIQKPQSKLQVISEKIERKEKNKTSDFASVFCNQTKTNTNKNESYIVYEADFKETNLKKPAISKSREYISSLPSKKVLPEKSSHKISRKQINQSSTKNNNTLNLVVIGHVDHGKSTLMGHLLYLLGQVNSKTLEKYKRESQKLGKNSFAFAWILDETEEERNRGITVDFARNVLKLPNKTINLMDAPGHKDYVPSMIQGASQADCALLVIDSSPGEFETGFEGKGQIKEHSILVRSLGIQSIIVAVNKMDNIGWSEDRYSFVVSKMIQFLTALGFKNECIHFVPCSGLTGNNLTALEKNHVNEWYKGQTLADTIGKRELYISLDSINPPDRPINKPLRMFVADIFKQSGNTAGLSGQVESGYFSVGDVVTIMPLKENATIKSTDYDSRFIDIKKLGTDSSNALAGDYVDILVSGIDSTKFSVGNVICFKDNLIKATKRFNAQIITFDLDEPLYVGHSIVFYFKGISESGYISQLISLTDKDGKNIKKNPKMIPKNSNAVVQITLERTVLIDTLMDLKEMSRFTLRSQGFSIAAGMFTSSVIALRNLLMSNPQSTKKSYSKEEWEKKLSEVNIHKGELNKLIMNYLIIEGYKEAAEKFCSEASMDPTVNLDSIQDRMNVRQCIQKGEVDHAIELTNDLDPQILDTNPKLFFRLQQQKLIEMIRAGRLDDAIEFAQEELAPRGEEHPEFLEELERTMALMIFDGDENSPVKDLLDTNQRQKTASELNSAILTTQCQEKEPKLPLMLKMLVWSQKLLEEKENFPKITNFVTAEFNN
ncbi:hypothetical protein ROZALSC1DRAFT_26462 [Rozella allomycis CSF55]|uniref:Elongation factor 1 alpha-like protein n=1 Tax=Rozella allomycis (strain CSF55) TaxID=988480 RepID=A0A075ATA2_ROZAC|nr:CTLH/CRAto LisH motif domain-containing protein [Rozella allomycis CSF55]RKP22166.1 hypothetical protein ROZALSC1DRAFT_26462 [Rozella allomycis CSF55]|eukprot:EPZ31748.1 CTLH/CRAto LisH motif domain-containing protein [Rozella allomycis CSF55]